MALGPRTAVRPDRRVDDPMERFQQRLQHRFADLHLLRRALTHRSFAQDHNERLEFLGDSVLNLAVAHLLYGRLHDVPEGELSRARASLVKQDSLHKLALELDLPQVLQLGEGEVRSGGRARPSILADALEAVIGAVFLDAGYAAAEALVLRLFQHTPIDQRMLADTKDAKTALQEWLQARRMQLPQYRVARIDGAAHQQQFVVECLVPEFGLMQTGQGASRRAAEQAAAVDMLAALRQRA